MKKNISRKKLHEKASQVKKTSKAREKEKVFVAKFAAIFIVLYIILLFFPPIFLMNWIASVVGAFAGLPVNGNVLLVDGVQPFEVSSSCTGLVSGIMLCALVFSFRKPLLSRKIALLCVGIMFLLLFNLFRVLGVGLYALRFGGSAAEAFHVFSWFVMGALVLLIWFIGMRLFSNGESLYEML